MILPNKIRIYFKIISALVAGIFLFQQVAWAGDLIETVLDRQYDEQSQTFAPSYLQDQQVLQENVIAINQDAENFQDTVTASTQDQAVAQPESDDTSLSLQGPRGGSEGSIAPLAAAATSQTPEPSASDGQGTPDSGAPILSVTTAAGDIIHYKAGQIDSIEKKEGDSFIIIRRVQDKIFVDANNNLMNAEIVYPDRTVMVVEDYKVKRITKPDGTIYHYNADELIESIVYPDGKSAAYSYTKDDQGNILETTVTGQEKTSRYDKDGKIKEVVFTTSGKTIIYTGGVISEVKDENGVTYLYNTLEESPDGATVRLKEIKDRDNNIFRIESNNIVEVEIPGKAVIRDFTLSEDGHIINGRIRYLGGAGSEVLVENGLIKEITDLSSNIKAAYEYTPDGNGATITIDDHGAITSYAYAKDPLTGKLTIVDGDRTYYYDAAGNLEKLTDAIGASQHVYDINRTYLGSILTGYDNNVSIYNKDMVLERVISPDGFTYDYRISPEGNIIISKRTLYTYNNLYESYSSSANVSRTLNPTLKASFNLDSSKPSSYISAYASYYKSNEKNISLSLSVSNQIPRIYYYSYNYQTKQTTSQNITLDMTIGKDIDYTVEYLWSQTGVNVYLYKSSESRPLSPTYTISDRQWDPRFSVSGTNANISLASSSSGAYTKYKNTYTDTTNPIKNSPLYTTEFKFDPLSSYKSLYYSVSLNQNAVSDSISLNYYNNKLSLSIYRYDYKTAKSTSTTVPLSLIFKDNVTYLVQSKMEDNALKFYIYEKGTIPASPIYTVENVSGDPRISASINGGDLKTEAYDRTERFEYDSNNRLIRQDKPDKTTIIYDYKIDTFGRLNAYKRYSYSGNNTSINYYTGAYIDRALNPTLKTFFKLDGSKTSSSANIYASYYSYNDKSISLSLNLSRGQKARVNYSFYNYITKQSLSDSKELTLTINKDTNYTAEYVWTATGVNVYLYETSRGRTTTPAYTLTNREWNPRFSVSGSNADVSLDPSSSGVYTRYGGVSTDYANPLKSSPIYASEYKLDAGAASKSIYYSIYGSTSSSSDSIYFRYYNNAASLNLYHYDYATRKSTSSAIPLNISLRDGLSYIVKSKIEDGILSFYIYEKGKDPGSPVYTMNNVSWNPQIYSSITGGEVKADAYDRLEVFEYTSQPEIAVTLPPYALDCPAPLVFPDGKTDILNNVRPDIDFSINLPAGLFGITGALNGDLDFKNIPYFDAITYGADKNIVRIVKPNNEIISYYEDGPKKGLIKDTSGAAGSTLYDYNLSQLNDIAALTVIRNDITTIYDRYGNVSQVSDSKEGISFTMAGDAVSRIEKSDGSIVDAIYDTIDNTKIIGYRITRKDGVEAVYEYRVKEDGSTEGVLTEIKQPDGSHLIYDLLGNIQEYNKEGIDYDYIDSIEVDENSRPYIIARAREPYPEDIEAEDIIYQKYQRHGDGKRLVRLQRKNLKIVDYIYYTDGAGAVTSTEVTDEMTNTKTTYGEDNNITRTEILPTVEDPVSTISEYAYGRIRNVYKGTVLIYRYAYEFDSSGREVTVISDVKTGDVKRYKDELLISVTDSKNLVTTYEYNADKKISKSTVTRSGKLINQYIYTYDGDLTIIEDMDGVKRSYDKDNKIIYLEENGRKYQYVYSKNDSGKDITTQKVISIRDDAGNIINYNDGKIVSIIEPDGTVLRDFITVDKTVTGYTIEKDNVKYFVEDGRVIKEIKADGTIVEYYPNGWAKSVTDTNGTTTYDYEVDASLSNGMYGATLNADVVGSGTEQALELASYPDPNQTLLLHMNGNDNSINPTHPITFNGGAKIDVSNSKFGDGSFYFDGNSTFSLADSADLRFTENTTPVTIDFWIYPTTDTDGSIFYKSDGTASGEGFELWRSGASGLVMFQGVWGNSTGGIFNFDVGVAPKGQWTHLAITKDSNLVWRGYADGIGGATDPNHDQNKYTVPLTSPLVFGTHHPWPGFDVGDFHGYIDEFRVSNSVRWTSNFTPPDSEYRNPYKTSGSFTSNPILLDATELRTISWNELTPDGTDITIQTRTGNTSNPDDGTWSDWSGVLTDPSGSEITSPLAKYLQYKVSMVSPDPQITPEVKDININYIAQSAEVSTQPVAYIIAKKDGIKYRYDKDGKLLYAEENNDRFYYDASGHLRKAIDKDGNVYDYTYSGTEGAIDADFALIDLKPFELTSYPDLYTKLLLHAESPDSSGANHPVNFNGDARLDNANSKFGSSAIKFDGGGDFLTLPDSDDWNFGTGAFTIDNWVRFSTVTASSYIWAQNVSNGNEVSFSYDQAAHTLIFEMYAASASLLTFTAPFTPLVNTWYHLAFVRIDNGNLASSWRVFIDGVSQTLTKIGGNWNATYPDYAGSFYMGYEPWNDIYLNGYMDEYRVSKGIARWTSNFTPPTTPHSADAYTKLLLHAESPDSSSSNHSATFSGDAHFDNSGPKFGSAAIKFDGSDDFLTLPDSDDWDFGTGDFTMDGWINLTANSATQIIASTYSGGSGWILYIDNYNKLIFANFPNTFYVYGASNLFATNTWYHIAMVRTGNDFNLYVNGALYANNSTTDSVSGSADPLAIGALYNGGSPESYFNGYIDEFRISKGIARWTIGFTPPDSGYRNILYNNDGILTSDPMAITATGLDYILANLKMPVGTNAIFKTRTGASSDISDGSWSGWVAATQDVNGYKINSPVGKYVQYQAIFSTTDTTQTPSLYENGGYAVKLTYNYNKTFDATAPPDGLPFKDYLTLTPQGLSAIDVKSLNYSLSEISDNNTRIKDASGTDDTIIATQSFKADLLSQIIMPDGTIVKYFNNKPVSITRQGELSISDIILEKYNVAITDYKVENGLLVGYRDLSADKVIMSFTAKDGLGNTYIFKNNKLFEIERTDGTTETMPQPDAFAATALDLLKRAFSPDGLDGERTLEGTDVSINLDKSNKVTYFINNKMASTYYRHDDGQLDLMVDYSYDDAGNLILVRLPYARDSINSQIDEARQKIAKEKADYLQTLAQQAGLAYQQIHDNVESVRAQINAERARLQPMLYQQVTRVSQGCFGPQYYTETVEVPEVRNALNQLDEQERILNDEAAKAYAQLSSQVAAAQDKLDNDAFTSLTEIERQEEVFHAKIIEEEATPVIIEAYRSVLGRDPDDAETASLLAQVPYDSKIDVVALKANLTASEERIDQEGLVAGIKTDIADKLNEYLNADAVGKRTILDSLGLTDNEVVSLDDLEVAAILAFLDKQNIHFGRSAFVSLEALLKENGISYNLKDLALRTILVDILTGSISAVSEGKLLELSMFALSKVASLYGLTLYNTKVTFDELTQIFNSSGTLIAHFKNNHFVVVNNIAADGKVTYTELNKGKDGRTYTVSEEDFKNAWTGYAMVQGLSPKGTVPEWVNSKVISADMARHIKGSCFFFLFALIGIFIQGVVTIAAGVVAGIAAVVAAVSAVIAPIITAIGTFISGVSSFLAGIATQIFTAIQFVGVSLLHGVGAFFGGTLFGGSLSSIVSSVTGFASTIMGTAIGKTVVLTALSFGISKGLDALGVNPIVASLISSFITGGVSGLFNSGFSALSFIAGGLQGLAVQGVSVLGQRLGLDPNLSSIIGLAAGSMISAGLNGVWKPVFNADGVQIRSDFVTGLDAISYSMGSTVLPNVVGEFAYYGVNKIGEFLGIDPRISYLAGVGIRSTINAGLTHVKPDVIWGSVTQGLLQGVTNIGLNYLTQEMGINPLLANIGFSAISTALQAGIQSMMPQGEKDVFKAMFETYEKNALTFLGYTEPGATISPWQQAAYISQILDFSNIVQERGLADALNTYGAGFFNAVAVNAIVKTGYTLGGYFAEKLQTGQYRVETINGQEVAVVDTPTQSDGGHSSGFFKWILDDGGVNGIWDPLGMGKTTSSGDDFWGIGKLGTDAYGKLGFYDDSSIYQGFGDLGIWQTIDNGYQSYAEIKDNAGKTIFVVTPKEDGGYNYYNSYGDYVDAVLKEFDRGYTINFAEGDISKLYLEAVVPVSEEARQLLATFGINDVDELGTLYYYLSDEDNRVSPISYYFNDEIRELINNNPYLIGKIIDFSTIAGDSKADLINALFEGINYQNLTEGTVSRASKSSIETIINQVENVYPHPLSDTTAILVPGTDFNQIWEDIKGDSSYPGRDPNWADGKSVKHYLTDLGADVQSYNWSGNTATDMNPTAEGLATYIKSLRQQYPDRKITLIGHSAGDLIVEKALDILKDDNIFVDTYIGLGSPSGNENRVHTNLGEWYNISSSNDIISLPSTSLKNTNQIRYSDLTHVDYWGVYKNGQVVDTGAFDRIMRILLRTEIEEILRAQ